MKFTNKIFITILLFIIAGSNNSLIGQGNTPCTAVVITANLACVNTAGTTASLTYQNDAANGGTPSCASPGAADGWYSFTPTITATYTIDLTAGTITDSGMSISTAASGCTNPTQLLCDDDSGTGTMSQIVTTLTAGTTYFIRIWKYSTGTGTFSICITQGAPPPAAPANDNPCNATLVTVNPSSSCTSQSNGSVAGATSSGVALGACGGTADDDVWYSFVATNTTHTVSLNNVAGSTTDLYHSVHTGPCGSIGAALVCSDPNSSTVTGLTIGNTYFIRVYTWTSTTGQTSTFSVCVTSPPPPPANDDPTGATPITPAASCSYTNFTTVGATGTTCGTIPAPGCASYSGGDVWFSVVVPASGGFILDTQTGGVTDGGMAVYSGVACGTMNLINCDDDSSPNGAMPSLTVTATAGSTVFVRFWEYGNDNAGTFGICATTYTPPAAPANDNPCSATPAPVNATYGCTVSTGGTVLGATSSTVGLGACFGTADDDVWYSFVANNATQNIDLTNLAGSTTDMYFSVHPGTCGAIGAALLCSDPQSGTVTGLTVGNTYYLRVYTYTGTSGQTSTFSVCIYPPPTPPANDNPCTATPAPVNATFGCTVSTGGTVLGATSSTVGLGACFGTADDDVWYTFVANNSTQNIDLTNLAGSTTDMYFSVHPGTCGAIGAALLCSDPQSGTVTGLTVGNTYYLRVYTYTGTTGQTSTFSVCIYPPCTTPSNDNCSGAIPVAVNSGALCSSQVFGTVCGATASGIALGACGGTADDDVWFSFVATNTAQVVSLNNVSGSTTDLYHSVYSGACGSLGAALVCSDPNTSSLTGLTVGNTYYIRIYSWTSTTGQTSTFSVCITTPAPTGPCGNSADNNFCSNPASLVPAAGTFSSSTSGLYTADQPGNVSSVFCGSIENNSWYYFVATATSASFPITSVTGCSSTSGIQAHVYSVSQSSLGCCTSFTSVSNCFNPGTNTTGTVTATPLTIGQTYVLMVDGNGGNVCNYTISNWSVSGVLPIELMTFVGRNEEEKNKIQWVTSSEKNTSHFTLEKSRDGVDFESVLDVAAAGESQSPKYYTTFDMTPYEEITYYRLKLFYYNSSYEYSNIISVNNSNLTNYISAARPNPTNGNIEFDINMKQKGNILIELYNNTGVLINSSQQLLESGYKSLNLDLEKYDSGIYLLKVSFENSGKTEIQKIIKN